jgi:histidyl-tRNA synthetase
LLSDINYSHKNFKGQLKHALKLDAKYLVIIGQDEYTKGFVGIKDTKTETQENIKFSEITSYIKEKVGK